MITKIFNGKYYSNIILYLIYNDIFFYNFFLRKKLILSILLIGNNFSSNLYVKNKIKACKLVNLDYFFLKMSKSIRLSTLIKIILIMNFDFNITGLLIQLPLVTRLNKIFLFNAINSLKDIDLLGLLNFGKYMCGYSKTFVPSTATAVLFLIEKIKIKRLGMKSIIFGFSNIVGKPIILELNSIGMTVSVINKVDNDFLYISKNSDLFISAIGASEFFSIDYLANGGIVIDIGINECKYKSASGDIKIDLTKNIASLVTPVPGGIGPLTVCSLLYNFVRLYINKNIKIVI